MTLNLPTPLVTQSLLLATPDDTDRLGQILGESLLIDCTGGVIYLQGELGAGKTSLVRALLRSCGVQGRIKSPSYALLETYKVSSLYFYHLDFYRFKNPQEWEEAGFRDLFHHNAVVLIEWPEKAEGLLPQPDLLINMLYEGERRIVKIDAYTQRGVACVNHLNLRHKI
jgi:tRNA threonylcarbamoyladenosine biosynthesis protein TsaE